MKTSIKIFSIAIAFFLVAFSSSQDQVILGNWFSAEMNNAIIEVYKGEDNRFYGKIVKCDKEEWVGETILKKAVYDESKKRWKGEIYSLKRKMTISVNLTLTDDNKLKLVGKKFLFSKTFYWERKQTE